MVMNLKNKIESDLNLKKIIKIVQKSKIDTYLVGGYVRDLFLNRKCKDIDFMTIGDPYSLVEIISSKILPTDCTLLTNLSNRKISLSILIFLSGKYIP